MARGKRSLIQPALRFTPRMLPIARRGHVEGDLNPYRRDDCQRQSECLRHIAMAHWDAIGAECPKHCEAYTPEESWLRAERTADGLRSSVLSDAEQWAEDGYIGRIDDA